MFSHYFDKKWSRQNGSKNFLSCFLGGVVLFSGTFIWSAAGFSGEIAKVDSSVISSESFASSVKSLGSQGSMIASNPELRKRFLDHMINSVLVGNRALTDGFDKDPMYQKRLAEVAAQLLAGEYIDRLVEKKSTEKEVKAWFDDNMALFSNREVHAHHILLADEVAAKSALAEVQKHPENFDKIAKKISKDKTIDLGFFKRGQMVPEFDAVAFVTPKGTIHPSVVKTSFGWHVIKISDVRGDERTNFDAVKADVQRKYRSKIQEDFVRELRAKSTVVINEFALKEVDLK
jgi:peptidyl-prolyl cis-trans isomerase C